MEPLTLRRSTEVFFLTDKGFAIPTVASIESLRRWDSASQIKVNVVLFGMDQEEVSAFLQSTDDLRVTVHILSADQLEFFDKEHFNKTHVPYSTLARFLIPQFAGKDANTDILYVDGDTWFLQDPKSLLDIPAPETGLLASEDQSYFYKNEVGPTGRAISAYFANIGVTEDTGYFNAGVIKCRADEWASICADCLSYLKDSLPLCRYHDQSALNAVASRKRIRLSPAWNFQTPYWSWDLPSLEAPRLLHFVGGGKPWMGVLKSWSSIYVDYMQVIRGRTHPLFPLKVWSYEEQVREINGERWAALKNKTFFRRRIQHRRERFQKLVDSSVL